MLYIENCKSPHTIEPAYAILPPLFVRALYVALPPVSRTLPPGDRAVMAIAGSSVMLALVDGVQACARFLAPDFIQSMLNQVGEGQNEHVGLPVSWRPVSTRPTAGSGSDRTAAGALPAPGLIPGHISFQNHPPRRKGRLGGGLSSADATAPQSSYADGATLSDASG